MINKSKGSKIESNSAGLTVFKAQSSLNLCFNLSIW